MRNVKKRRSKKERQLDKPVDQIMRTIPEVLLELFVPNPEDHAYSQTQIKQVELRPDGLITDKRSGRHYIFEFHARTDSKILEKAYVEAALYGYQNCAADEKRCGVFLVFTKKSFINHQSKWAHVYNTDNECIYRYVCLDELLNGDSKWRAFFLVACETKKEILKAKMPKLWDFVEKEYREKRLSLKKYK